MKRKEPAISSYTGHPKKNSLKQVLVDGLHRDSPDQSCSISHRAPQYLTAAAVTIGGFSLGNCLGYSSPALPDIESSHDFSDLKTIHLSWIGSLVTIGALFGSMISGHLIAKIGRKRTLLLLGVPFTVGWLIIAIAQNIDMLYAGRFLTGVSVGALSLVAPVYLSEISEPEIRGFLGAVFQITVSLGILFTFVIGSVTSWRILAAICAAFPLIFTTFSIFLPESPRYLLTVGNTNDAIKVLSWLRSNSPVNPSQKVLVEIEEMQGAIQQKKKCQLHDLITSPVIKPLLISFGLMFFNQFCGANAVGFYTVSIFKEAELGMDAHLSSIIVGIVQVIATILAAIFVDKAGRRFLLQFSFATMSISLLTLGTFFYMKNVPINNNIINETAHWIPLACVVMFNAAYCGGVGCLIWTVMSEILPGHVIGVASGLATTFNWTLAFFTTRFFHDLNDNLGIHNTFLMFAAACAIGLLFVFACVPETKAKTLSEIQEQHFQQEKNFKKAGTDITSVASSTADLV